MNLRSNQRKPKDLRENPKGKNHGKGNHGEGERIPL